MNDRGKARPEDSDPSKRGEPRVVIFDNLSPGDSDDSDRGAARPEDSVAYIPGRKSRTGPV